MNFQVNVCKQIRGQKDRIIRDSLSAAETLKTKLEEEFNENKDYEKNLMGFEAKIIALRSKINKIDPMDYKSIKSIYEEAVYIKKNLNVEYNNVSSLIFSLFTIEFIFYRRGIRSWANQSEIQL